MKQTQLHLNNKAQYKIIVQSIHKLALNILSI